jgi:hypothetical protein
MLQDLPKNVLVVLIVDEATLLEYSLTSYVGIHPNHMRNCKIFHPLGELPAQSTTYRPSPFLTNHTPSSDWLFHEFF